SDPSYLSCATSKRNFMENLGNQLYGRVNVAQRELFEQSALTQLTFGSFDIVSRLLQQSTDDTFFITYSVGWLPNNTPINDTVKFLKDELMGRYQFLAYV